MPSPYVLCDVFTDRPFAGNPLAVFLEGDGYADDMMFAVAREFGWSEVTFVQWHSDASPRVRIWTPSGELPFAGHPTVGTAVVLASLGRIPLGKSTVQLGIGPIVVDVTRAEADGGSATMTQLAPTFGPIFEDRGRLAKSLGLDEADLAPDLPAQVVSTGLRRLLVPVRSLDALARVRPDPDLYPPLPGEIGARWAYVFTTETPGSMAAARSRLLTPGSEDAATGSAAGPLGAYLVHYGLHRPGAFEIEQGIEMGRPSRILVDVPREDGEIGPVHVSGDVCIWGHGTLTGDLAS
jgi:trans-2,3-dihydro-3-hydroxyanthranilate isomerase